MEEAAEAVLDIQGLHKAFGTQQALKGVSFSLGRGERLAFLGPNGAGKTTLIRCLSGRTRPDRGKILLLGRPIGDPARRDLLGLVPQEIALYADLTTRENLTAFAKFHQAFSRLQFHYSWISKLMLHQFLPSTTRAATTQSKQSYRQ